MIQAIKSNLFDVRAAAAFTGVLALPLVQAGATARPNSFLLLLFRLASNSPGHHTALLWRWWGLGVGGGEQDGSSFISPAPQLLVQYFLT